MLLRPTNHNILENREFVANSQRFVEEAAKGQGEARVLSPKYEVFWGQDTSAL